MGSWCGRRNHPLRADRLERLRSPEAGAARVSEAMHFVGGLRAKRCRVGLWEARQLAGKAERWAEGQR